MLARNSIESFQAFLRGEIALSDLPDEAALIFAREVSAAFSNGREYSPDYQRDNVDSAKHYLRQLLDYINSSQNEVGKDDGAPRPFVVDKKKKPVYETGTRLFPVSGVPDDWQVLTGAIDEMMGTIGSPRARRITKVLFLVEYEGAPDQYESIGYKGGYTYISNAYKRWLIDEKIARPKSAIQFKPDGWISANSPQLVGGDIEINKLFIAWQEGLIPAVQEEAGISDAAARCWVEENAIGIYRNQGGGQSALFAAPWVIEQMVQEGLLKRRDVEEQDKPADLKKVREKSLKSTKEGRQV